VHFTKTSTGASEICADAKTVRSFTLPKASNDTIRRDFFFIQTEERGTMLDKKLNFLKSAFIKK